MTSTTKYVLIGGGALVAVVFIAKRMAQQQQATKSTGLAGVASSALDLYSGLKSVSWGSTGNTTTTRSLATGGTPYGPGISDGYAAVSDATGMRSRRLYVPAQETYDPKLAGLA